MGKRPLFVLFVQGCKFWPYVSLVLLRPTLLIVLITLNFSVSKVRDSGLAGPLIFHPEITLQSCPGEVLLLQLKEDGKPSKSGDLRNPQPSN